MSSQIHEIDWLNHEPGNMTLLKAIEAEEDVLNTDHWKPENTVSGTR